METNYVSRDIYGIYKNSGSRSPTLMGADTLLGNEVYNIADESLGTIKEFLIEMRTGRISYAVLAVEGLAGSRERLFAVPWQALKLDTEHKRFTLNVSQDRLKSAPAFERDHWPEMANSSWESDIHRFYGVTHTSRIQ